MKIITLLENTTEPGVSLIAKHGLSLYLETGDHKLLFDMGPDASLLQNAEELGVDLAKVDIAVISHAHYDHGGGLKAFLEQNQQAKVYLSSDAGQEYYSAKNLEELRYIGLDRDVLKDNEDRLHFIQERTEIIPGITLLPVTEHSTFKPRAIHLCKKDGSIVQDSYEHELIMTIEEDDKLHVFTGCSHSGILNMVLSVKKVFPDQKIHSLVGGFHLMNTTTGRMNETRDTVLDLAVALKENGVEKIYTGHCTGTEALGVLQEVLGENIFHLWTGRGLNL